MCDLKGKTALITGASRGIGCELAIGLAKCGADVAVNYVGNDAKANEVKAEIEKLGRKCILAKVDLSNKTCAEEMYESVQKVDILVLNASVQYRKSWSDISIDEFETQMNCNFRCAILLIQKFAPHMKEQNWGRIVTIGSVQETKPHPDMLVYSSSKAALAHMAKSLAFQLAPNGITVNSIAPGVILTDRNTEALSDRDYYNTVVEKIPVGFCGDANDCFGALKLLCSKEGRYITGQNIFVDGGMGIK